MHTIDFVVVAIYMAATMTIGLWLSRRASRSLEDFFVGGRAIPWWLAGASMAATTFNVDTPLYVGGLVITRGVAGNWEWWSFVVAHVAMIYLFARLWRRAGIVTDVELYELRYGGRAAASVRGVRAAVFALPINAVAMAYGMLAMRKVVDALGIWEQFGYAADEQRLWTVIVIAGLVLVYAAFAGLWGVVATDFFQLIIALIGAFIVVLFAIDEIGGIGQLPARVAAAGEGDHLRFTPDPDDTMLPFSTFLVYIGVQWWAFRNADGGGQFVQRLVSVPDEADAERAAWLFNIVHYVIRAWPWILVGLMGLVVLPDLQDPETAYPALMKRYLPVGILGLVFASLLAAFMSTVSSQVNWGASYLVNDVYRRFIVRGASERHLVWAGRVASLLIAATASYMAFHMQSIQEAFRFLIVLGAGTGAVLILRWFWWRINAWAEIAALITGVGMAVLVYTLPALQGAGFALRTVLTAGVTTVVWIVVMFATPAERPEVLDSFFARARPGGFWGPVRERTGLTSRQDLRDDLLRTAAGVAALLGATMSIGALLLQRWSVLLIALPACVVGVALLSRNRRSLSW